MRSWLSRLAVSCLWLVSSSSCSALFHRPRPPAAQLYHSTKLPTFRFQLSLPQLQNRKLFREVIAGSVGQGLISSSMRSLFETVYEQAVFLEYFPPWYIVQWKATGRIWGGRVGGVSVRANDLPKWLKTLNLTGMMCKEKNKQCDMQKTNSSPRFAEPHGNSSDLPIKT